MYLFDKNGNLTEIDLEDVISIERRDHLTLFRTGPDHYCPPATIKELADIYNRFGFYRSDRAVLINLRLVDRVVGNKYYIGHHAFKVSRSNELSIKKQFEKNI